MQKYVIIKKNLMIKSGIDSDGKNHLSLIPMYEKTKDTEPLSLLISGDVTIAEGNISSIVNIHDATILDYKIDRTSQYNNILLPEYDSICLYLEDKNEGGYCISEKEVFCEKICESCLF